MHNHCCFIIALSSIFNICNYIPDVLFLICCLLRRKNRKISSVSLQFCLFDLIYFCKELIDKECLLSGGKHELISDPLTRIQSVFHMTRRSWCSFCCRKDGPGLYILTRTRQESDFLLLFCTHFFLRLGDLKVASVQFSTAMSRCFFFMSGQPLYRQGFENVDPDDDELIDELDGRPEFIVWITCCLEDIRKMHIPDLPRGVN